MTRMANRGFLMVWYARYGLNQLSPNPDSREVWQRFVVTALAALRAHHPEMPIALLDIDKQLQNAAEVRKALGIIDPAEWYAQSGMTWLWRRQWIDKAAALQFSPFQETILVDVDILAVGSMSAIFAFDLPAAALWYPNYQNTPNHINTGVWLAKPGMDWSRYWQLHRRMPRELQHNDEAALSEYLADGGVVGSLVGGTYGADPHVWLWRERMGVQMGPFHNWVGPLRSWAGIRGGLPEFAYSPEGSPAHAFGRISAFHLSSCKTAVDADPMMVRYRADIFEFLNYPIWLYNRIH